MTTPPAQATAAVTEVRVTLPLPDGRIGPNGRAHWREKARLVAEYRDWAFTAVQAAMYPLGPVAVYWPAAVMHVEWRFAGTQPDSDNVIARLKPARDAAADAGLVANDRTIEIGRVTFVRVPRAEQCAVLSFVRIEEP